MAKEIKSYWDTHFLSEYITLAQIPRGLRIKKFPSSELFDDTLKEEWTNTLSICSLKLMDILVRSNQKSIDKLQMDMASLQKELTPLQSHTEFSTLDGNLNKRLDKLEKSVIDTKRGKMNRDNTDYESGRVYVWKKSSFQTNRPRRNRKKTVGFSDPESEFAYDTLGTTGSDSSPERTTMPAIRPSQTDTRNYSHPHVSDKSAKKKKPPSRKHEGGASDTKALKPHYTLRGRLKE